LPRGNTLKGTGGGHVKLALKAMKHAKEKGFDAVVLVTDADGYADRFKQFCEAQDSPRFDIPRALGIAIETFDAWILADHVALSKVLGGVVDLQSEPEGMRDPKTNCRSLMQTFDWPGSEAEFYEAVCKTMDLDFVSERCPKGFAPFLQRVSALNQ